MDVASWATRRGPSPTRWSPHRRGKPGGRGSAGVGSAGTDLAVYLTRLPRPEGRVGLVVKQCDVPLRGGSTPGGSGKRDDLVLLGASLCRRLTGRRAGGQMPYLRRYGVERSCDIGGGWGRTDSPGHSWAEDPRDEAIAFLEALPADQRWRFWQQEFGRCIRCYACRGACSLCYCETLHLGEAPTAVDLAGHRRDREYRLEYHPGLAPGRSLHGL